MRPRRTQINEDRRFWGVWASRPRGGPEVRTSRGPLFSGQGMNTFRLGRHRMPQGDQPWRHAACQMFIAGWNPRRDVLRHQVPSCCAARAA